MVYIGYSGSLCLYRLVGESICPSWTVYWRGNNNGQGYNKRKLNRVANSFNYVVINRVGHFVGDLLNFRSSLTCFNGQWRQRTSFYSPNHCPRFLFFFASFDLGIHPQQGNKEEFFFCYAIKMALGF